MGGGSKAGSHQLEPDSLRLIIISLAEVVRPASMDDAMSLINRTVTIW
jgi:hypothetical protein